ncbi:MAG: glycoside hydrolase family 3 C-terminal domain-containing protein, partial [Mangrovibacterium sp.]
ECLHGVARAGYATVFPQSISVAASWNKQLVFEVASVISDEARAKHHEFVRRGQRGMYQGLNFWSPNINIFRDPRWGRGHETYGEDPYLTGELGREFVLGLQGDDGDYMKVIATAKHFAVHSGPEPLRHGFDVDVSERDLQETYLPAFRKLVQEGGVYSVMGAYNRFRGEACCASEELFHILREKWGFQGFVVSDCGAVADIWKHHRITPDAASAAALAVKEGCDLNCGTAYQALEEAYARGLVTDEDLDVAVKRLFTARFKLGMFDPVERVPYARIPYSVNDNPAHDYLARQAARESIVLLKNQDQTLPLSRKLNSLAVIGPNADEVQSLWGNYNGIPSHPVTVLQGIRNKLEPQSLVLHARGSWLADGIPELKPVPSVYLQTPQGQQGVLGEYYASATPEGEPLFTRVDDRIDFVWDNGTPDPRLKTGAFSVRWKAWLVPPKTGTYWISDWGKPYLKISCNGKEVGGRRIHHGRIEPVSLELEAGRRYLVEAEYRNSYGDATARLLWSVPEEGLLEQAVEIAKQADAVVLVLGLNERLEGEEMHIHLDGFAGGDRTHLDLPDCQRKLMQAVFATGKQVVLVLINGSALSVNWAAGHIPAILTAGYPGQQGGNAIADVLFGDYNPAGRLPVTYYKSADQLPPFDSYDMAGRTYRYFTGDPLFPFGHGLSYTCFSYDRLEFPEIVDMKEPVKIRVRVSNTGNCDGDEVVQLYLTDEKASTPRPVRQLEGFERISLKKGESRTVEFTLIPRQLALIDRKGKWVLEPGWFTVSVGGKQPGFSGLADAYTTSTIQGRFRLKGKTSPVE